MTSLRSVVLAAITAGIVTSLPLARGTAQAQPNADQTVAALKQNLADSQKRLRQYEWIETTVISLNGEEKSRKQQKVYYGADGKLTKLPVAEPEKAEGGRQRGIKKNVAENKKEEMQDYMERAGKLIHSYVPPNPALIQQAKDKGNMALSPQPDGKTRVEFKNFVQPSDQLTIGLDPKAGLPTSLSVASYLDKPEDAVTLNVRFGTLTDGTSYAQQTTLDAKAKNVRVVVENSGHRPLVK